MFAERYNFNHAAVVNHDFDWPTVFVTVSNTDTFTEKHAHTHTHRKTRTYAHTHTRRQTLLLNVYSSYAMCVTCAAYNTRTLAWKTELAHYVFHTLKWTEYVIFLNDDVAGKSG